MSLDPVVSYSHMIPSLFFFFFNDTATTDIYPLSLHDALPICPVPTSSELWNHPRYWSPPSIYMSAGHSRPKRTFSTARWLEPESNHTSRMSFSLLNSFPPHLAHRVPTGSSSAAVRSYQIGRASCRERGLIS